MRRTPQVSARRLPHSHGSPYAGTSLTSKGSLSNRASRSVPGWVASFFGEGKACRGSRCWSAWAAASVAPAKLPQGKTSPSDGDEPGLCRTRGVSTRSLHRAERSKQVRQAKPQGFLDQGTGSRLASALSTLNCEVSSGNFCLHLEHCVPRQSLCSLGRRLKSLLQPSNPRLTEH
jgi:hypothetical protein